MCAGHVLSNRQHLNAGETHRLEDAWIVREGPIGRKEHNELDTWQRKKSEPREAPFCSSSAGCHGK